MGRRAGLIGLGLLFAGFNTGNNLFYLMFALMAACELVGFWLAGRALRRIQAAVSVAPRGSVGIPLRMSITLHNPSRWLPVPSLTWRVATSSGDEAAVVTPKIAPASSVIGTGRCVPSRRGHLAIETLDARTEFPLGLARRSIAAKIDPARPLLRTIVSPRLGKAERSRTGSRRGDVRQLAHPKGSGEEPIDAREYRPGDDARRIDWKASARTERLMWRDRRGEPPRALSVRFDRSGSAGPMFEQRVSRAAATVAAAIARGRSIGFVSDEWEVPPRSGPAQRRHIFEYLALVEPSGRASPAAVGRDEGRDEAPRMPGPGTNPEGGLDGVTSSGPAGRERPHARSSGEPSP